MTVTWGFSPLGTKADSGTGKFADSNASATHLKVRSELVSASLTTLNEMTVVLNRGELEIAFSIGSKLDVPFTFMI